MQERLSDKTCGLSSTSYSKYYLLVYTLYILEINTWGAEWHIYLTSCTKDAHLIFQTTVANRECFRSRSSASYRRHQQRDAYSISDHQRSARLPPHFTIYGFYPYTIKVHENKSSWWDETLILSARTLYTVLHILAHSFFSRSDFMTSTTHLCHHDTTSLLTSRSIYAG